MRDRILAPEDDVVRPGGGIGTTRGLQGFVDFHQLPFRVAFPNRQGGDQWNDHPELKRKFGGGGHCLN